MDKPELQELHEGKTVIEILQDTHKTANLDAMEPLALLSTSMPRKLDGTTSCPRLDSRWSLPQGEQRRSYCRQRDAAMV